MQPRTHCRPGQRQLDVFRQRVVDGDVGVTRGISHQANVRHASQSSQRPARRITRNILHTGDRVIHSRKGHSGSRQAQRPTDRAFAPGRLALAHQRLQVVLQRLQMHDVEQRHIGNDGRQGRMFDDFRVRDADILDHQKGRRPHHWRHDLAIDRRCSFNGTGLHTRVAGAFHQRNGEDAARHHVGDR